MCVTDGNDSLQSMYQRRCDLSAIGALADEALEWNWMRRPTYRRVSDCRKLESRVQFDESELFDQDSDWLAHLSESESWTRRSCFGLALRHATWQIRWPRSNIADKSVAGLQSSIRCAYQLHNRKYLSELHSYKVRSFKPCVNCNFVLSAFSGPLWTSGAYVKADLHSRSVRLSPVRGIALLSMLDMKKCM
jgi:hypothetical protein